MPYIRQIGMSASQDRLEHLIANRLEPGANKEQIDARIWDLFGEEWAVMFTDLAGFSRNVGEDQARAGEILVTGSVKKAAADERSGFTFEPLSYVPPGAESAYKLIYDQGA